MNAHSNITSATKRTVLHHEQVAKAAADLANAIGSRDEDYCRLVFLDRLRFVIESDLDDEIEVARREAGVDEEGYPLDQDGYTVPGAERRFIPAQVL